MKVFNVVKTKTCFFDEDVELVHDVLLNCHGRRLIAHDLFVKLESADSHQRSFDRGTFDLNRLPEHLDFSKGQGQFSDIADQVSLFLGNFSAWLVSFYRKDILFKNVLHFSYDLAMSVSYQLKFYFPASFSLQDGRFGSHLSQFFRT